MRHLFTIVSVLLPILAISGGIVRSEWHLHSSRSYSFAITGYDPRDLLRGRYIQFRVQIPRGTGTGDCSGPECCLCLQRGENGEATPTRRMSCASAPVQCDAFVIERELRQIRRYYISEAQATSAEAWVRQAARDQRARVRIEVDAQGHPQLSALTIDGRPLEALLAEGEF